MDRAGLVSGTSCSREAAVAA
eukprot:COSAG02_NODE_51065_length_316_cov_1.165899_1_plen_20_part_01